MFYNLSGTGPVGFCGKFEHGTASLRHICKHKEVPLGYLAIAREDPADRL